MIPFRKKVLRTTITLFILLVGRWISISGVVQSTYSLRKRDSISICNRTIFLSEVHESGPEPPSLTHGTLLLDSYVIGRLGNVFRSLFHGIDMARDRNLSLNVMRTSHIGRQIVYDAQGLFPFLSEDQMESIFGFRFTANRRSPQTVSTSDVYYYGGVSPTNLLHLKL